jgi:hypothetical protein
VRPALPPSVVLGDDSDGKPRTVAVADGTGRVRLFLEVPPGTRIGSERVLPDGAPEGARKVLRVIRVARWTRWPLDLDTSSAVALARRAQGNRTGKAKAGPVTVRALCEFVTTTEDEP